MNINIFKNRKRAVLGVASLLFCILILLAGLWPYSFALNNDVKWLVDKNGIIFHGLGIVYSKESLTIPAHNHPNNNSITIELWLQSKVAPARHLNHFHKALWHYGEILSFNDNPSSMRKCATKKEVILGGGTSLLIELLQFHLPTRTSSLTDLICNIIGTILGITVFHLTISFLTNSICVFTKDSGEGLSL